MTKIIASRRRFKSRLDAKQDVSRPIPALMGNGAGTIEVPNQPGYVYIRIGDGDLGQAFNNRAPLADNLAIDVGYDPITDPDRRIFQVLSVRMADYAGSGNTPYPNLPNHHEMHEFGGGDDTYISWRRLMGFRVGRPAGFVVTIDEGNIIRAGAWLAILAQTLDLTASKPALATQARYVLITLDSAGVATSADGALVAVAALDISNCPIPAAGEIPLAAVRMYGTQTAIGDVPSAPDIIDLRFPQAASTGNVYLADLEKGTAQYQIITSGPNPYSATWSAFKIQGTANGITNLAVTATKTLTLTSADDLNLTAERTGAVLVRTATPNIVGDAVGAGNARGQYAVDMQLFRGIATQVASGVGATISGGNLNTATGTQSSVIGGTSNISSGLRSSTLGGDSNVAAGDYSVAAGRQATIAAAHAGSFLFADHTNAVFNSLAADEFAIRARGGFRHAYDDSNYWQATVSAAGAVTLNATGASAGFAFSDVVTIPAAGLVVTGMARGDLLVGNATPTFGRLPKGAANAVLTGDGTDTAWSAGTLVFGGASSALTLPNAAIQLLGGGASCQLTLPDASCIFGANGGTIALGGNTLTLSTNSVTLFNSSGGLAQVTIPATGTVALLGTANVFTANQTISNATPSLVLTDTTAAAKGLTIAVDANKADLRESAGASGSLLLLDLANNRAGVGTSAPLTQFVVSNGGAEGLEIDTSGLDQNVYFTTYDRVGLGYIRQTFRASDYAWNLSTTSKMTLAAAGLAVADGFGCNTKAAQTAYASGGALAAYVDGTHGLDTAAHMQGLFNLVVNIRAALVANGIMS